MKDAKLLETITSDIMEIKKQNQDMISIDVLLEYLNAIQNEVSNGKAADQKGLDINLAEFRTKLEHNLAHYNSWAQHSVEMFRAVVSFGQEALKSAILINGGAAVALLAFIGSIWTKGINQSAVKPLTTALILFASGVVTATLGTSLSYVIQYCYSKEWNKTGTTIHIITLLLILFTFILFFSGSYNAYSAFVNHLTK